MLPPSPASGCSSIFSLMSCSKSSTYDTSSGGDDSGRAEAGAGAGAAAAVESGRDGASGVGTFVPATAAEADGDGTSDVDASAAAIAAEADGDWAMGSDGSFQAGGGGRVGS